MKSLLFTGIVSCLFSSAIGWASHSSPQSGFLRAFFMAPPTHCHMEKIITVVYDSLGNPISSTTEPICTGTCPEPGGTAGGDCTRVPSAFPPTPPPPPAPPPTSQQYKCQCGTTDLTKCNYKLTFDLSPPPTVTDESCITGSCSAPKSCHIHTDQTGEPGPNATVVYKSYCSCE
jgi:hypothetical protein